MQAIFLDLEILICSTEWLVFHKTSMCRSVPASFWCVLPVITSSRRERDWFWLSHSSATRQGVSPSNSGTGSPGPAQSAQVKFGTFRAIFAKVQLCNLLHVGKPCTVATPSGLVWAPAVSVHWGLGFARVSVVLNKPGWKGLFYLTQVSLTGWYKWADQIINLSTLWLPESEHVTHCVHGLLCANIHNIYYSTLCLLCPHILFNGCLKLQCVLILRG